MNGLARILRTLAGGLFVVAGALKAFDPAAFATDIDHYHLLPYFALAPLALYLPWLEIICGSAVIAWPAFRRGALILLFALIIGFTGAIIAAMARHLDISCGCFGAATAMPLSYALVRNVILGGIFWWLLRVEYRCAKPGPADAG
ncbi:MAG TPA: MauE/DoxX family redox-associated membrane protein [Opitutaceae bacterium]|nr:MauE/DoxX family redox-associated membrane protein [Opitutaceae bacterium]